VPPLTRALAIPCIALLHCACQSEYPIAPTLCDELCHAQDNAGCGSWLDEPAECVLWCEALPVPNGPDCNAEIREVIACLQELTPGNDYCLAPPCGEQYAALWQCSSATAE